ncbi:MAG: sensor domain-containing diguanylate cyclase [Solirubrobacterales bacterium]
MLVTNGGTSRLLDIIDVQGEIAAGDLDQHQASEIIVSRVPGLIGADGAVISIPDGDDLVFHAGSGIDPLVIGWHYPRDESLSGLALTRRQVLLSGDAGLDPRVDLEVCEKIGARSILCAPLLHDEEELGALTAFSERRAAFDEEDREVIGLLGRSLGAHLHHAAGFAVAAHLSLHDHLTGLQNRRAYEMRLETEVAKARRQDRDLTLCLLDLDHFKAVNDHFGHVAGDEVLRAVAHGFDRGRLSDDAFRIGGDEFALIFPGCGPVAARAAVRRLVDGLELGELTARGIKFGVSFGLAGGLSEPKTLHAAADQELNTAKHLRHLRRVPASRPEPARMAVAAAEAARRPD